jgi:hypothetical protein
MQSWVGCGLPIPTESAIGCGRNVCDAAGKLGRPDEAVAALARWRPVFRPWLTGPLTEDERKACACLGAQRSSS